jgi:HK97 family phage prohead protease
MNEQRQLKKFDYKSISTELSVKDVDTKSGIVTGYFASFGTIDSCMDMIIQGAFKKTIAERGPGGTNQIKHLLQHDCDDPIGAIMVLKEDKVGLYFESKMSATSDGQDVLTMYAEGIYNEHSIGYRTMKDERVEDTNGNLLYYKLTEIKLWEGSTVLWGANPNTPFTGFKSANGKDYKNELDARMNKCIKAISLGNLTDETYQKLEIELLKINEAYKSLITAKPEIRTTQQPNDGLKFLQEVSKYM